jgi:hypothetical protein
MLSYSALLQGAIIQEFSKQFNIEYSDTLYRGQVYYTDVRAALKKSNILLQQDGEGFVLRRHNVVLGQYNLGVFSAPFLNAWVTQKAVGIAHLPMGFGVKHPKTYQGGAASFSEEYRAHAHSRANITTSQADAGALETFLSDEIVTTGRNKIYKLRPQLSSVPVYPASDYVEDDGTIKLADPGVPFYLVIRFKSELLNSFKKIIARDGLSWEFADHLLFVANTLGAFWQFPPAPGHLIGLPFLDICISAWENIVSTEQNEESDLQRDCAKLATIPGMEFFSDPSALSFYAFCHSAEVALAYATHKKDFGYSYCTRAATNVLRLMRDPDYDLSWYEFNGLLSDMVRPETVKGKMLVLFKIAPHLIDTNNGRVAVMD